METELKYLVVEEEQVCEPHGGTEVVEYMADAITCQRTSGVLTKPETKNPSHTTLKNI